MSFTHRFLRTGGVCTFTFILFLTGACAPGNEIVDPDPPTSPVVTVKADIGCRSGPTADYAITDTLRTGEILTVTGRNQKGDSFQVFNPDLQGDCWVGAEFVDVSGALSLVGIINPDPPDKPSATVKADAVCRSGPSADYGVLDTLKAGDIYDIQGRSSDGNSWVVFSADIGGTCWVEAAWVDAFGALSMVGIINPDPPFKPSATVKADAVCRSGPSADYGVLDTLKAGDIYDIQGRSSDGNSWVVFSTDIGGTCWVEAAWVDVTGALSLVGIINPEPPNSPAQGAATATVKQNSVCRDGPTTEYKILAYFNTGEVLNILGKNRLGTSWVVENPSTGGQCWIAGNLVDVGGNTDLVMIVDPEPPSIVLPTATVGDHPQPFNCAQYNFSKDACIKASACQWDPAGNGSCVNNP